MDPEAEARVESLSRLPQADLDAVSSLVDAATEADGVDPLSEQAMLDLLRAHDVPTSHLLVFLSQGSQGDQGGHGSRGGRASRAGQDEQLAGYAHLDLRDERDGASAEVVVHPRARRHGVGRLLVQALEQASPDGRLRLWAHGRLPAAAALASSLGYAVSRELWQMRRQLGTGLPDVPVPEGLRLRAFRPGQDDEAWVALNAVAFADHPEQGTWTLDDLRLRMAEPWFDPAGFLVLEDDDGTEASDRSMAAFHWTKVHQRADGDSPVGEVYVVGVSPDRQGQGLGRVITVAGLEHLRSRGLTEAMLYTDADNTAAVRTYERLGFIRSHVDVQFSRPGPP